MKTLTKTTEMIRWRLRVLMAERNLSNKQLAEMTGLHRVTISNLKRTDELKQITGETLNLLCQALKCTPNDLIEFTPEYEEHGPPKQSPK